MPDQPEGPQPGPEIDVDPEREEDEREEQAHQAALARLRLENPALAALMDKHRVDSKPDPEET